MIAWAVFSVKSSVTSSNRCDFTPLEVTSGYKKKEVDCRNFQFSGQHFQSLRPLEVTYSLVDEFNLSAT
jgi:hypothetical protein